MGIKTGKPLGTLAVFGLQPFRPHVLAVVNLIYNFVSVFNEVRSKTLRAETFFSLLYLQKLDVFTFELNVYWHRIELSFNDDNLQPLQSFLD